MAAAMLGAGLAYGGICIAFVGEAQMAKAGEWKETLLGMALVFASALTYAAFILLSGTTNPIQPRGGAL